MCLRECPWSKQLRYKFSLKNSETNRMIVLRSNFYATLPWLTSKITDQMFYCYDVRSHIDGERKVYVLSPLIFGKEHNEGKNT